MAFQQYPQKFGIPSGNTAGRPSSPITGDTYYNGETGILEIYDGTDWVPCSAPSGTPIVSAEDVGTSRAYTSGAITFTFTPQTTGGAPLGYTGVATSAITATIYQSTTTTTGLLLSVGGPDTYTFYGNSYNGFGTSPNAVPSTVVVTTVPEAPTIGTATISTSTTDVAVTWTLGNSGGKNLSAITITPYLDGTTAGTAQTAATTSSTTHTFTGLTSGSAYTFKVKATNANGVGLESSATNSITVPTILSVDFLVVAGGGGGGRGLDSAGGGGAGGLRSSVTATGGSGSLETALNVAKNANISVTVGAGGSSVSATGSGGNGENSIFSSVTSTGGGGGGGSGDGLNGGSGGGGGANSDSLQKAGGLGLANQGFNGRFGLHQVGVTQYGGGGGGASENGPASVNTVNGTGGVGGAGRAVSITGSSVTYAGGGGGSGDISAAGGAGGGGAAGAQNATATSGTANLGGGGGAAKYTGTSVSGSGGSGVVILRYLTSAGTITIGAGLTGSTTTNGSSSISTITAGSGNVSWA
jgi:hypothetical protein